MGFIWKNYKEQVMFDRNYMPGFTPRSLKHHKSLISIWLCNVVGFAWCWYCCRRTLRLNSDSLWLRRDNHEQYHDGHDYHFINMTGYRPKSEAPRYRREGDPPDHKF